MPPWPPLISAAEPCPLAGGHRHACLHTSPGPPAGTPAPLAQESPGKDAHTCATGSWAHARSRGAGGGEEHSSFLVGDEAAGPCRDPSPRALNQSVPTQPRFQVCPCCCCCCFGTGNAWGRAAGVGRETSDQRHNPMTCRRRTGLEHCQRERQALFGHSR